MASLLARTALKSRNARCEDRESSPHLRWMAARTVRTYPIACFDHQSESDGTRDFTQLRPSQIASNAATTPTKSSLNVPLRTFRASLSLIPHHIGGERGAPRRNEREPPRRETPPPRRRAHRKRGERGRRPRGGRDSKGRNSKSDTTCAGSCW